MTLNPYTNEQRRVLARWEARDVRASQEAIARLRRTRPWVMLFSIMLGAMAALMLLTATLVVWRGLGDGGPMTLAAGAGAGVGGMIVLRLALHLRFYARSIRRLSRAKLDCDLDAAMLHQLRFWRLWVVLLVLVITVQAAHVARLLGYE